jgi:hypothetical protein
VTAPPQPPAPLPPVESLTPESDFAPFLREGVEEAVKRRALKTLFQDPRFNVMDGLDVYIDDYSKPDPLPEGWLEKLNQVARLGDYREPDPQEETPGPSAETPDPPAEPPPPEKSAESEPPEGSEGQEGGVNSDASRRESGPPQSTGAD